MSAFFALLASFKAYKTLSSFGKLWFYSPITYTKRTPRYVQTNRLLHIQDTRRDKQRKHTQQEWQWTLFLPFGLYLLYLLKQVGRKYKIVQFLIVARHHRVLVPLPFRFAIGNEHNVLANAHHRVHVVRVDNGCNVKFLGNVRQKLVDNQRRLGVEPGVRLVAEQVFGVHYDGTCNGYTLLHSSRYLFRQLVFCRAGSGRSRKR